MQEMMNAADIAFPHLNLYLHNVPKTFSVFGFQVAFYGLIIGIAVLAGVLTAVHEAKVSGQDPDIYWDFAIYAIFFSIVGARIYFVAFSWDQYKDDLLSIFNLRGGGIAIYGAVIGAFTTAAVYCYKKKIFFPQLCDTGVMGLILGQAIGRWGNFMNREAFGQYSDGLFAMRLPIEAVRPWEITASISEHIAEGTNYIQVHPTFLYESMWNLFIFTLLLLYRRHKKYQGEIAVLYLGGYGLGRCFIEGLRTDQLLLPHTSIAVSQMLAGVLVVAAVITEAVVYRRLHQRKAASETKEP
ncbi:MAG: prolipoprotein diacylglyceryl transferase [Lachnospiraceae bacterium]|nr:prolipoprotein diacylglyceryl transferase [Lachnospiraceae bacterium]